MKEHKRIENNFTWVPMDKRTDRWGQPLPPRKAELRKPLLWLERDGSELYLVNLTDETLEHVRASNGGYQTVDDEAFSVSDTNGYYYTKVLPNEAVMVDAYDGVYDLDYILQVYIDVKSKKLGNLEIASPAQKGGVYESVLLWDSGESGESGKDVWIKEI